MMVLKKNRPARARIELGLMEKFGLAWLTTAEEEKKKKKTAVQASS